MQRRNCRCIRSDDFSGLLAFYREKTYTVNSCTRQDFGQPALPGIRRRSPDKKYGRTVKTCSTGRSKNDKLEESVCKTAEC